MLVSFNVCPIVAAIDQGELSRERQKVSGKASTPKKSDIGRLRGEAEAVEFR